MADQAGHSASAIAALSSTLTGRHTAVADADRALAEALTAAHAATVEGLQRLDAIAADIDAAVAHQEAFALDTAAGAHEFHRFLLAKQREISDIVSSTAALSDAKSAALQELLVHYRQTPTVSTP
ncbi:MAG: DUF4226 domain-containing protein [Mycobacterium sp.]